MAEMKPTQKIDEMKPTWKIENMVASVTLGVKISLKGFLAKVKTARWDPNTFPGLIYFVTKKPSRSVLVFDTGKLVCAGAKNMDEIVGMVDNVIQVLKRMGIIVKEKPIIEVTNMVSSAALGVPVHIEHIAFKLENAEYEPEQFPGMVYRMMNPKVAILLFTTGRVVVAGAKQESDVEDALWNLVRKLKEIDELPKEYPNREEV